MKIVTTMSLPFERRTLVPIAENEGALIWLPVNRPNDDRLQRQVVPKRNISSLHWTPSEIIKASNSLFLAYFTLVGCCDRGKTKCTLTKSSLVWSASWGSQSGGVSQCLATICLSIYVYLNCLLDKLSCLWGILGTQLFMVMKIFHLSKLLFNWLHYLVLCKWVRKTSNEHVRNYGHGQQHGYFCFWWRGVGISD